MRLKALDQDRSSAVRASPLPPVLITGAMRGSMMSPGRLFGDVEGR